MISIQHTISELEKTYQARTVALECYLTAINSLAQYPVELDSGLTSSHRQYLAELAAELSEASPEDLAESRAKLRGLLRDYRERAAQYLGGLRDQLSSTAEALTEMVEGLAQTDTDHSAKLRNAMTRLREVIQSPAGGVLRPALLTAVDTIEDSLEQIRKQHQLTVSQFHTELRLLHNRIDSLETAATLDETTKFSNRRFFMEYLGALPEETASFLILKLSGLAQARGKYGPVVADEVVATFGRRLRNTLPKDAVIGRWSEQDFLAIPAAGKPVDAELCRRVADHLSMPYACMVSGKVVRIPLEVTLESLIIPPGGSAEERLARVTKAFE